MLTPADRGYRLGYFPLPELKRFRLRAPAFMRGLRVLFVSDVHLRKCVPDRALEALVALMNRQRPSLLLLGGDYAEAHEPCERFFEALKSVKAPLGGCAVLGNNDWQSREALSGWARAAGLSCLINARTQIDLGGGRLEIAGCDDLQNGAPVTRGLFSGAPDTYRILVSHYPVPPDCRCDLMLSGHTHAGQINLGGLTPYSFGYERHCKLLAVRGLSRVGDMQLLVGNGVGVSRLPLRVGATPEIYLLEFE